MTPVADRPRSLEGLVVPDTYPAVPQPADVVRIAPDVVRPVARAWKWSLVAVLAALVLAVAVGVWIALEVRWDRLANEQRKTHEEAVRKWIESGGSAPPVEVPNADERRR